MDAAGQGRAGSRMGVVVFDLAHAGQDRDQVCGDQPRGRAGRRPVQHIDARGSFGTEIGAQGLAFLQPRHMKPARAFGPQPPRNLRRAQPIAVRLDHRRHLGALGLGAKKPVIGRQGVEVDGQAGSGGGHERCLAQFAMGGEPRTLSANLAIVMLI